MPYINSSPEIPIPSIGTRDQKSGNPTTPDFKLPLCHKCSATPNKELISFVSLIQVLGSGSE